MFSEELKAVRKILGFSQNKLAIKIGIPLPNIQKWEQGITIPPEWCQVLILKEMSRL